MYIARDKYLDKKTEKKSFKTAKQFYNNIILRTHSKHCYPLKFEILRLYNWVFHVIVIYHPVFHFTVKNRLTVFLLWKEIDNVASSHLQFNV